MPQCVEVADQLFLVKLPPIVEDHCSQNAKVGDDVFPNKRSNLGRGNRGDSPSFYPLCKVVHCHEEVLALPHGFGEGPSMSMPQVANSKRLVIGG